MFCIKCGQKLEDYVKFCPYCGHPTGQAVQPVHPVESAKLEEVNVAGEPTETGKPNEAVESTVTDESNVAVESDEAGEPTKPNAAAEPTETGKPAVATHVTREDRPAEERIVREVDSVEVGPGYVREKKSVYVESAPIPPERNDSGKKKGVNAKVIAVAGSLAACVAICAIGGVILLTRNPMRHNVMITSDDGDVSLLRGVQKKEAKECKFAEDAGTYEAFSSDGKYYYFLKDVSGEKGDLCRVKVSSLGSDKSRNEKNQTEIASSVELKRMIAIGKTGLLYVDGDELHYYDGKDDAEIDDHVERIITCDDKKVIYGSGDGQSMELHMATIEKEPEKKTIDEDVSRILDYNMEHLTYTKDHSEEGDTICIADRNGKVTEVEKKVKDFGMLGSQNGEIWYGKPKTTSVSLYDYVDDNQLTADVKAKRPQMKSFLKAVKFKNLKTNYTKPALIREIKRQITKKDGYYVFYFLSDYGKYYAYSDQWKKFYHFDKKGFVKAEEDYREVDRRNQLRKSLKEQKRDTTYYELYYYKDGKSTKVEEDVLDARGNGPVALYRPFDHKAITKVGKLSDFRYYYQVEYKVNYGEEREKTTSDGKTKVSVRGKEGKEYDVNFDQTHLDVYKNQAVLTDREGTKGVVTLYSIKKDGLEKEEELTDDGVFFTKLDDRLFYYDNVDTTGKGDLYCYDGDDSKKFAEDVYTTSSIRKMEDNTFLILSGKELSIIKDGDIEELDDDVRMAQISKDQEILYLDRDGDLYSCTDVKDGHKIAEDVKDFSLYHASVLFAFSDFDD